MTYVQHVLQPDETILNVSKIHRIIYVRGWFFIILGILAGAYIYESGTDPNWYWAAIVLAAFGLLLLIPAWARRWTTEMAVTNRRVIYKRGFIRRHTIEMNMDKVESVDVDQTILGRIFNFGTVMVHGTGEGIEPIRLIADPIEFRNSVIAK